MGLPMLTESTPEPTPEPPSGNCGRTCPSCPQFCVPGSPHFFDMLRDCGSVCKTTEPDERQADVSWSEGKFHTTIRKRVDCQKLWTSPHVDVPLETRPITLKELKAHFREL